MSDTRPLFSEAQYQPSPYAVVRVDDLRLVTTEENGEKVDYFSFGWEVKGGNFYAELERFHAAIPPYPQRQWLKDKRRWLVRVTWAPELCRLWPVFAKELEAIAYPVPDLSEEASEDPWAGA